MLDWLDTLTFLEHILLYIAVPATLLLLIQTVLLLVGLGGGQDADADGGADLDGDGVPDSLSLDLDGDGIPDASFDLDGNGIPDALSADLDVGEAPGGVCGVDVDGDGIPDHDGCVHDTDGGEASQGGLLSGLNVFTVRGFITFFTLFGWSGLLFCQLGLHWLLALFLAVQIGVIGMVAVAVLLREALRLQSDGTLDIRNALGETGSVYLTVPAGRAGVGKVNVVVQDQLREFEAVTDGEAPIPTGAEVTVTGITNGDTLIVAPRAGSPA